MAEIKQWHREAARELYHRFRYMVRPMSLTDDSGVDATGSRASAIIAQNQKDIEDGEFEIANLIASHAPASTATSEVIEKYARSITNNNGDIFKSFEADEVSPVARDILTRFATELRETFVKELGEPRAYLCPFDDHKVSAKSYEWACAIPLYALPQEETK